MTGNYDNIPYPPDYGAPHAMTRQENEYVEALLFATLWYMGFTP